MEKKSELKTKTISLALPQGSFPCILYANRCMVDDLDGHKIVIFGFEHGPERRPEAYAVFACLFDRFMLQQQKEAWLKYLSEVGYPEPSTPMDWRPPPDRIKGFPAVNSAAFSRTGDDAEIKCYNFSMGDVTATPETLGAPNVVGQSIALIRCDLDLQLNFLVALFEAP